MSERGHDTPLIAQWESPSRWYCVELAPDLFGCWVLTRIDQDGGLYVSPGSLDEMGVSEHLILVISTGGDSQLVLGIDG